MAKLQELDPSPQNPISELSSTIVLFHVPKVGQNASGFQRFLHVLLLLRVSFNPIYVPSPFYFWAAPALNRVDTEGCSILSPPVPVIQFGVRTVVNYLEKAEHAHVSQTLSLVDYNLVDMPLEPLKVHGLKKPS
jgi:hypothetical protein